MSKKVNMQSINMNDINKFVKGGAFDRQMKAHMPQIMAKVQKIDAYSRKEAEMDQKELETFKSQLSLDDKEEYINGVKDALKAVGYRPTWVDANF